MAIKSCSMAVKSSSMIVESNSMAVVNIHKTNGLNTCLMAKNTCMTTKMLLIHKNAHMIAKNCLSDGQ